MLNGMIEGRDQEGRGGVKEGGKERRKEEKGSSCLWVSLLKRCYQLLIFALM